MKNKARDCPVVFWKEHIVSAVCRPALSFLFFVFVGQEIRQAEASPPEEWSHAIEIKWQDRLQSEEEQSQGAISCIAPDVCGRMNFLEIPYVSLLTKSTAVVSTSPSPSDIFFMTSVPNCHHVLYDNSFCAWHLTCAYKHKCWHMMCDVLNIFEISLWFYFSQFEACFSLTTFFLHGSLLHNWTSYTTTVFALGSSHKCWSMNVMFFISSRSPCNCMTCDMCVVQALCSFTKQLRSKKNAFLAFLV